MGGASEQAADSPRGLLGRALRVLRPSHEHSAFSATLLLMSAMALSRVIGFVRESYIAWAFGANPVTDAYFAAFSIPDFLNYILAGGTASITFVSIFTRYVAKQKRAEAEHVFSVIITVMSAVLAAGILLMEVFTPQIIPVILGGFKQNPEQLSLCVHLTRVLLPAQLFFYVGGVVSAVLLSQRLFLLPALAPLIYNVSIILGGLLGRKWLGIASLALGALAGSILGPFVINAIGAWRVGVRYRPSVNWRHPAFLEWVRLSIPLMLGVSLVTADDWILRFFASYDKGAISHLNYAKRLFLVPIAILGQAAGQAALPFFARLFGEGKTREFAASVNDSVYRISATSFLIAAWMVAAAQPVIGLLYRRGSFLMSDSRQTAAYFFVFSLSLAFWSAQAIYSRAFYAAANTFTPMVASTVIAAASLPVYYVLFKRFSVTGLAAASDVGIVAQTLVLIWLLNRRGLVPWVELRWLELGKAVLVALGAGLAGYAARSFVVLHGSRLAEMYAVVLATAAWAAVVAAGLWLLRSELPAQLTRKKPA